MRKPVLPALLLLLAAATACGLDGEISSAELGASELALDAEVVAFARGATFVVRLSTVDGRAVAFSGDDRVYAAAGGARVELQAAIAEAGDVPLEGLSATRRGHVPTVLPGAPVHIELERANGERIVTELSLPGEVEFAEALRGPELRGGEALGLRWSPLDVEDVLAWRLQGECVDRSGSVPGHAGAVTLELPIDATCEAQLVLERSSEQPVAADFGGGAVLVRREQVFLLRLVR